MTDKESWAVRLLVLAAAIVVLIECVDAASGGQLGAYHREYAGGGSLKWRGAGSGWMQTVLLIGLAAYGLSALSAILAGWLASRESGRARQRAVLVALGAALVFSWLVFRGVASAALELG